MTPGELNELELRDYVAIVRRRWKWLAALLAASTLAAILYSLLQTPMYQATAEVLIARSRSSSMIDPSASATSSDRVRDIENELQLARSSVLEDRLLELTGLEDIEIDAERSNGADLLKLQAVSTDPIAAADTANLYADQFVQLRREFAVQDYAETGQVVQRFIDQLSERRALEPEGSTAIATIDRQITVYQSQLDSLTVNQDLAAQGQARLISPAEPPEGPFEPQVVRNLALAMVLGLILGTGLAFLRDHLDDDIGHLESLEAAAGDVPTLAMIPEQGKNFSQSNSLITATDEHAPASEAYRSLWTSVQFAGLKRKLHTIQVTSSIPGEGKTVTATNLAITAAKAGYQVTLVDLDLRLPRVHEYFRFDDKGGFADVALGRLTIDEASHRIKSVPGLRVLTAGTVPQNPLEILASARTSEVLSELMAESNLVVVDGPPVLPVTDARVLSYLVDGTIFVARVDRVSSKQVSHALGALADVDAKLLGTVLNGVDPHAGGSYAYGYGAYGGNRSGKSAGSRKNDPVKRVVLRRSDDQLVGAAKPSGAASLGSTSAGTNGPSIDVSTGQTSPSPLVVTPSDDVSIDLQD